MNSTVTHPRPQLRRAEWTSLDGEWQFAIDAAAEWVLPAHVCWNATILVPYSP